MTHTLALHGVKRAAQDPGLVFTRRRDIEADLRHSLLLPPETPLLDHLSFPRPDIVSRSAPPLFIDTHITEPRRNDVYPSAAAQDGFAARRGERLKMGRYRSAVSAGYMRPGEFSPFVLETGGRLGQLGCDLLYLLARMFEGKRLGIPTPPRLSRIGGHFLGTLRILISSSLQRALSRRALAISDSAYLSSLVLPHASPSVLSVVVLLADLFPLG